MFGKDSSSNETTETNTEVIAEETIEASTEEAAEVVAEKIREESNKVEPTKAKECPSPSSPDGKHNVFHNEGTGEKYCRYCGKTK